MSGTHRTCEICGMKEKHCSEKRFYARFPLDKHRCVEWLKVVGKEDLALLPIEKLHDLRHVCEIHFSKRDFTKSGSRLKKSAVPKLHLTSVPQLKDDLIAEFLQLNSNAAVPSVSTETMPGSAASASCSAIREDPAAVASTSQSISPLDITSAAVPSVSTETMPGSAASASCSAIREDPAAVASTSQSISPLDITSVVKSARTRTPHQPGIGDVNTKQPLNKGAKRKLDDVIDVTPRKKKLMMQLRKTKCTLASLKKSATLIENLSSTVLKDFVISALKNQKRKPQGKRWTLKNKISALAIFKRSPKAYRYLQHVLPLPSIKTLQNILKKIPMKPGINPAVLKHLRKVADNFKEKDKFCTLAFDEIALKQRLSYNVATDNVEGFVDLGNERKGELANHALVFMLQGVGKKIKQPLAFYFVKGSIPSEKLAVLIKEIIKEVSSTGFKIIATICDQGPTNLGALRLLKEWHKSGENYFEMDDQKVFFIFDVPHLFKSIRNNFLKQGGIKMGENTAKWSHIKEVEEQNRTFLYLSKITPTHVQPKYRAKMRVKYAAQILSQTVAVVLKLLAKSVGNELRLKEITQSAIIVEDLNKLFDFTNGPSSPDDIKKGIRENVSAKSDHVKVWAEFRKKLSTLKFVGNYGAEAKNVRCIEGYITTLKSLSDIWSVLQEAGYKYLNLRQLNQDALENLFGVLRQHSPTNRHPTCSTFMAALKTSIISGMTAPHSRGSNCEKDNKILLTDFHDVILEDEKETQTEDEPIEKKNLELLTEPPVLSLPDDIEDMEIEADLTEVKEQPLVYVSGYIASKIIKNSKCISCIKSLTVSDPADNPLYELIQLKEWWQGKQCLTYPSVNLCRMVEKALNTFQNEVISNFHCKNICQWTVTLFHTSCDTAWSLCQEHEQSIKNSVFDKLALLFVRRQCQRVNLQNALKEEDLADTYKKGQQHGIAK